MPRVYNWQIGRTMSYWYSENRPKKQFGAVFDINKCIECQTCTLACKTTWTSGRGQEFMLWNNVETKPYGSYPLAVAAYNAGPGNVNKWLRANGDPRTGAVDWLQWIEQIPVFETKNYVQRVLENAVVYEQMNPDKVRYGGPRSISRIIGKNTPG